jgi:hypothetical protein
MFFMGLWVEAIKNRHFDVEMCAIITETLLFTCVQGSQLESSGLREKSSAYDHHVPFDSRAKLRHFVCTLSSQHDDWI